jgi:hypothetical protein
MKGEDKAKNLGKIDATIKALIETGRIADNEETKKVVKANPEKDYDTVSGIYNALPATKTPGAISAKVPDVNTIIDMAKQTEGTKKVEFKGNAIARAMAEEEANRKGTTEAVKA